MCVCVCSDMSEEHTAALEKLCRVCGERIVRGKTTRKHQCLANSDREDNPLVHPAYYCHLCHNTLSLGAGHQQIWMGSPSVPLRIHRGGQKEGSLGVADLKNVAQSQQLGSNITYSPWRSWGLRATTSTSVFSLPEPPQSTNWIESLQEVCLCWLPVWH